MSRPACGFSVFLSTAETRPSLTGGGLLRIFPIGCSSMSIWKTEVPPVLPPQTNARIGPVVSVGEGGVLMFSPKLRWGLEVHGGEGPRTLAFFELSRLEKNRLWAYREISNYPHLCPASNGTLEMKPLAIAPLALPIVCIHLCLIFFSGTISPAS